LRSPCRGHQRLVGPVGAVGQHESAGSNGPSPGARRRRRAAVGAALSLPSPQTVSCYDEREDLLIWHHSLLGHHGGWSGQRTA